MERAGAAFVGAVGPTARGCVSVSRTCVRLGQWYSGSGQRRLTRQDRYARFSFVSQMPQMKRVAPADRLSRRCSSETDAPSEVENANLAPESSGPVELASRVVQNADSLGVFRSFFLFAFYFAALLFLVRRSIMAATLPFERILLSALAITLPDLARYSFADLSRNIAALQNKSALQSSPAGNGAKDRFPMHVGLVAVTTCMNIAGFLCSGIGRISSGAIMVALARFLFDAAVQLRWVNGSILPIRLKDRIPALLLDSVVLALTLCCHLGLAPIACASCFLLIVCSYHLSKYDIELLA